MELAQFLRSFLQRRGILHDKRDGPFKAGHIVLDDRGFAVIKAGRQQALADWSDVQIITTMKRDLYAYDSICLGFQVSEGRWVEICEEMVGFKETCHVMRDHFPSINEDWYFEVLAIPFALNFAVLWRRDEPMGSYPCSSDSTTLSP